MNLLAKLQGRLKGAAQQELPIDWLEGARLMDECESFFVEAIGELEELQLSILLVEGKAQAEEPLVLQGVDFGVGRPIRPDGSSRRFFIQFSRHRLISYSVSDESCGKYPVAPERFSGKWLRIFSASHLLEFTRAHTQYPEELDGPMQHYEIVTQNHVIDVIATGPPVITVIR
ncbi:hypothetical protein Terro_4381 [Terriglobus roseus DSM 18391]|uniref:Uncharacterized protein n=1 Tax=Terriglobus roseus (strain DSM 18391 / NRRL B-41598 / KBS 63) TaxID=926566 RepID=I3ZMW0_TERRK|nr:hypothetical protein [Terriglobus roseus]AFL90578.1 hypothetical protein Terro_4381 [Terriglobus roseus DSM 18391]